MLPELAEILGGAVALAWIVGGFAVLWLVDRYLYPVCPACSHPQGHEHAHAHPHAHNHGEEHCEGDLHGFAPPLLIAAALHAALDGWSSGAGTDAGHFGKMLNLAIAVHKLPEGLALGLIVRASMHSRWAALGWCVLAESATLAGAVLEGWLAPHIGHQTLYALLAVAAGTFLYLGGHAVHGEWKRRGVLPSFLPAVAGAAGSGVLRIFGVM
jgi:zinc transporter ZupT